MAVVVKAVILNQAVQAMTSALAGTSELSILACSTMMLRQPVGPMYGGGAGEQRCKSAGSK
jgi:hypothetical protein